MATTSKWTIFLPALCLYPGEYVKEEFDEMMAAMTHEQL